MKLVVALLVAGAVLVGYAMSLAPYSDKQRLLALTAPEQSGRDDEYTRLRDELLTGKYRIEDYGFTLIGLAGLALLATKKGRIRIETPQSPWTLAGIGICLPFLTAGGMFAELSQAYERGEFPPWADSMGIPLMGVFPLFIILFAWAIVHLRLLSGPYLPGIPLVLAISGKSSRWLLCMAGCTAVLTLIFLAIGDYWYAIPGLLWIYLYLSLAAVLRGRKELHRLRAAATAPRQ